ncbi:MAG: response regulator transcription factor [Clostridia bacterium]|nr:response regulator transcription factor [Clostridia bacterium]
MRKILVCEDEASIRSFVVVNLRRVGFEVLEAASGEEALALYEGDPTVAIALLDVMLPGIDGFETCRRLRGKNDKMGIIMLTALSREEEKVCGLRVGADDYVTKPFGTAELLARVEALYRRLQLPPDTGEKLRCGELTLDMRARCLVRDGQSIELTQIEYQMVELFFRNPGRLLTRAEILEQVWHNEAYGDDKIVDVNIRRLRMKVETDPSVPRHLLTVWGRGYQWNV